MKYVVIIEKAADGSFSAYVPDLPGCVSCGDTRSQVKQMIREAITAHIESLREHGEAIPAPSSTADVVDAA